MRDPLTTSRATKARIRRKVWIQTLAYYLSLHGNCTTQSRLWDRTERRFIEAPNQRQAWQAAQPALAYCANCPAIPECQRWAIADHYTGLAAGQAWVRGHPQTKPRPTPTTSLKRAKSKVL